MNAPEQVEHKVNTPGFCMEETHSSSVSTTRQLYLKGLKKLGGCNKTRRRCISRELTLGWRDDDTRTDLTA